MSSFRNLSGAIALALTMLTSFVLPAHADIRQETLTEYYLLR